MSKIDFTKAKADITEIVEIVKGVPEPLQQRCFEMLFELAFSAKPAAQKTVPAEPAEPADAKSKSDKQPEGDRRLAPSVIAFCRRQEISEEQLGKLFMFEQDPMISIYKIPNGNMAKAQVMKVLMVLLENALANNSFSATYGELRGSAREDGLIDSNFNKNLKKNSDLFRGNIRDGASDETAIELSTAGLVKLGEVVKELAQ